MKKTIITIFAFLIIAGNSAYSQANRPAEPLVVDGKPFGNHLAIGIGMAKPSGALSDLLEIETGFEVTADYFYQLEETPNIFITGNFAFQSMNSYFETMTHVFLGAGATYFFTLYDELKPYAGAELGLTFIGVPEKYPAKINSTFGIAIKGGLRYRINSQLDLDANLKYYKLFTDQSFNMLGLNIGVSFPM